METLKIDLEKAFENQTNYAAAIAQLDTAWKADPISLDYDQIAEMLVTGATFKDILREPDQKLAEQLTDLSERTLSIRRIRASMIPTTDCFNYPFDDRDIERKHEEANMDMDLLATDFVHLINSVKPPVKE